MRSVLGVPFALFVAGIANTGCYSYAATEGPVPEGEHVELVVSTEARQALTDRNVTLLEYASKEAGTLTGLVLAHTSDSMFVEIPSARTTRFRGGTTHQRIKLANSDVVSLRRRSFNATQTGATVGVIGTFLILVLGAALGEF